MAFLRERKAYSFSAVVCSWRKWSLKGPRTDFSRVAREVKCYLWWLTSSYSELTRKPTHKQKSPHKLLFASKVIPRPSSRSFSDQLRMRKLTDFRFEKNLKFRLSLNWINFFSYGTFHLQIQNIGKHRFFQIIFFENFMCFSVSFISLKRTFFKIKRKPCLAGCKNEYKLWNHWLNTQIV